MEKIVTSNFWENLFIGSLLLAIPIFTFQFFNTGYFWDEKYSDILKNTALLNTIVLIVQPWFLEYGKFNPSQRMKKIIWTAIFLFILKYCFYEYRHLANKWSLMI